MFILRDPEITFAQVITLFKVLRTKKLRRISLEIYKIEYKKEPT